MSDINIQVQADTGQAVSGIQRLQQQLAGVQRTVDASTSRFADFGNRLKGMGESMAGFGSKMSVAVSLPLAILGKKMVESGSSMKAMHQTYKTVFGDLTAESQQWAKDLSKSVGFSAGIIDKANLAFAKQGSSFGLRGKELTDFSQKWTKLTLDLAQFNDVSIEEAQERLSSGLRGEADAVEKLGIFMGEANLKQQLMTMGIKEQWSELDMVTKQEVLYQMAMKQTAQAQGQASRESDSYQVALQNLNQSYAELAEKLFVIVEPAVTSIMKSIKGLVDRFANLDAGTQKVILIIAGLALVLPPIIIGIGMLISAVGTIIPIITAFGAVLFSPIGVIALLAGAITALVILVIKNWSQIKAWTAQKWAEIKGAVANAVNGISSTVSSVFSGIGNSMKKPIDSAVSWVKNKLDYLKGLFSGLKLQMPKIPQLHVTGKFSLNPISVPKIDWFAKGGLFNSPSVIGVGEAGDEAVLPLTNSKTMAILGAKISEYMPDKASNGDTVEINNSFTVNAVIREESDIEKLGKELYKLQQRESRRMGRSNI